MERILKNCVKVINGQKFGKKWYGPLMKPKKEYVANKGNTQG